jgi:hypothetical protein
MGKSHGIQKFRIGPVGEAVLLAVGAAGFLAVAIVAPNALQLFSPLLKKKKRSPKQEVGRNIESLLQKKLMKRVVDAQGNVSLTLTRRGQWEYTLRHTRLEPKQKKWDKRWRVVVFDVPNTKGNVRSELRRGMKLFGFRMIQRSVWVYPYPCDDFIVILRSHLGVGSDVLYMTVDTIENDFELRREFKLQ